MFKLTISELIPSFFNFLRADLKVKDFLINFDEYSDSQKLVISELVKHYSLRKDVSFEKLLEMDFYTYF